MANIVASAGKKLETPLSLIKCFDWKMYHSRLVHSNDRPRASQ